MNSVRIIERRVAFTFSHIPKVQQSRAITAFRSIGAPSTRQLCYSYRPRINRAQRLYPRNPNTESVGTRRYKSTKQTLNPTPNLGSPEPAPSLSQRLKQLSREYGWTAVGVYLLLSALDFPFCFLAVRALGTERIGQWEHAVIQFFKSIIDIPFPGLIKDTGEGTADTAEQAQAAVREGGIAPDSELSQPQEASSESDASKLATSLRPTIIVLTKC
jgi:hypothetical protein